jgi:hypothetical protein
MVKEMKSWLEEVHAHIQRTSLHLASAASRPRDSYKCANDLHKPHTTQTLDYSNIALMFICQSNSRPNPVAGYRLFVIRGPISALHHHAATV